MNHFSDSHSPRYYLVKGFLLLLLSNAQVALAEDKDLTIELKPLALGANLLPGTSTFGFSVERNLESNWTLFGDLNFLSIRIPHSVINSAQEGMSEQKPVPQKLDIFGLGIGSRYCASTIANSWYGGAKLQFLRSRSTWIHASEKLREDADQVVPTLEGGYRWVGESGFSVRLGLVAALGRFGPKKITRDSDSVVAIEGEEKLKKNDVYGNSLLARMPVGIDLGVGYSF
ncbi:MAG: hypothetical protein NTV34_20965 [Proteobacteria bacterium]|nr:hypothetical protein [Pseudomonadota bacterium]